MIYVEENGNTIEAECEECGRILKFRKNLMKYNSSAHTYTLSEPVECFCETVSSTITNVPQQETNETLPAVATSTPTPAPTTTSTQTAKRSFYPSQSYGNIPRCPTCGSSNIQKISLVSKAVGGYFFGVFSSNIRHTYKCLNCGYKW